MENSRYLRALGVNERTYFNNYIEAGLDEELGAVQEWVYEMIIKMVYSCSCVYRKGVESDCPVDRHGFSELIQIRACGFTVLEWLDNEVLTKTLDSYEVINAVDTKEVRQHLLSSPELQKNFLKARDMVNADAERRWNYIYNGGLEKDNAARIKRWEDTGR